MLLGDVEYRKICVMEKVRNDLDSAVKNLWKSRDRYEDEDINHVPIREDEKKAIQPLVDKGYEYIGHGCARIVLRFPDSLDNYVVKLARFGDEPSSIGMWQNQNELKLWSELYSSNKPLLPIFDWQEPHVRWLVMPYGDKLSDEYITDADSVIPSLKNRLKSISELDELELEPVNFVMYNNKPYLSDYGIADTSFIFEQD